ncbi:probable WRKY transcription factor 46 [Asparagus officinalis]|uniref:probable WRKY transcription factor 46 n=1 Tax=Asparagus officinalis TaxID=4686 RepID=UPI00098DF82D|nr:probable WRKY transcription factor 46 [Asparagus officinalis]
MASKFSMRSAIEEINRGKNLMNLLYPHLQQHTEATELSKGIQQAFESALAILKEAEPKIVSGKKRRRPEVNSDDRKEGGQKRKKSIDSRTIITPAPYDDGHQWRKYGQKKIHNSKHPRSYYRCTHSDDQKCQATKLVQQEDDDSQLFKVIYSNKHTCNDTMLDNSPQIIVTSPSKESNFFIFESKSSYSKSNNISKKDHKDSSEEKCSLESEICSSLTMNSAMKEKTEEDSSITSIFSDFPSSPSSQHDPCGINFDDIDDILNLIV